MILDTSEVALPDGSAFFVCENGDTVHVDAIICEYCDEPLRVKDRWLSYAIGIHAGPSWLCEHCGYTFGAIPAREGEA